MEEVSDFKEADSLTMLTDTAGHRTVHKVGMDLVGVVDMDKCQAGLRGKAVGMTTGMPSDRVIEGGKSLSVCCFADTFDDFGRFTSAPSRVLVLYQICCERIWVGLRECMYYSSFPFLFFPFFSFFVFSCTPFFVVFSFLCGPLWG